MEVRKKEAQGVQVNPLSPVSVSPRDGHDAGHGLDHYVHRRELGERTWRRASPSLSADIHLHVLNARAQ
jgi:hypothetical protein